MSTDTLTKRFKQFEDFRTALADPFEDGEIIYHYTSAEGLRGILENNEIWLTNTAFVNDTTECKALWDIDGLLDDVCNKYLKEMSPMVPACEDNATYIASFSKCGNSFEQWRAYGNYCIGFEVAKLIKNQFNLYKCVYEAEAIKDWILEKSAMNEWEGYCLDDMYKKIMAHWLIYHASMKYKNKHYKNEEEVRLITVSHHTWEPYPNSPGMFKHQSPIHFRNHPVHKIPLPYVKFFLSNDKRQEDKLTATEQRETARQAKRKEFEWEMNQERELLPIKEIQIGPMVHQKDAKLACEILLSEKGYKDCDVNPSNIPYRGF